MLASNPAAILDQIFGRAGIALTQESTQDDHALVPTITEARVMIRKGDESDSPSDDDRPDDRGTAQA